VEKITHQNLRLGNCFEAPYTGPMDSLEENFTARDKNSAKFYSPWANNNKMPDREK